MRVSILLVALAFVAVATAQPAAPIHKGAQFGGGAPANCQPGEGIIALNGGAGSGCADCLAGYYQPGTGTLACTACPAGTWSPVGSSACYTCPDGTVSGAAADACDECGFGTVANGYFSAGAWYGANYGSNVNNKLRHDACTPCAENYYQPKAAQTDCLPCPPNTSTAGAKGAGACFAVGGGHTVGEQKTGATPPAGAFLETAGTPKLLPKSDDKYVKPAKQGPPAPIRKSTRGNKKPQTPKVRGAGKPTKAKKF